MMRSLWIKGIPLMLGLVVFAGGTSSAAMLTFDDLGCSKDTCIIDGNCYDTQGAIITTSDGAIPLTCVKDGIGGALAHSKPYGLAVGPGDSHVVDWGTIRIDFVKPGLSVPTTVRDVTLWAGDLSPETDTIIAIAYDSSAVLAYDKFVTVYGVNNQRILSLQAVNISYITISATHVVTLDDVSFSFDCDCPHQGDCNDDDEINPVDVVYLINYALRMTGPPPPSDEGCPAINRGDWDCNGIINLLDVVKAVDYVYRWHPGAEPCDPCP